MKSKMASATRSRALLSGDCGFVFSSSSILRNLLDEKSGSRLTVPVMEKVGQLRQTAPPKEGQVYWRVFANEGKIVKPGDLVDVVIGSFRAEGLPAEQASPNSSARP